MLFFASVLVRHFIVYFFFVSFRLHRCKRWATRRTSASATWRASTRAPCSCSEDTTGQAGSTTSWSLGNNVFYFTVRQALPFLMPYGDLPLFVFVSFGVFGMCCVVFDECVQLVADRRTRSCNWFVVFVSFVPKKFLSGPSRRFSLSVCVVAVLY